MWWGLTREWDPGKRGRKFIGGRKRERAESWIPEEVGEIGEKYPLLHNILQYKKFKEAGTKKREVCVCVGGGGLGSKGSRTFRPPSPPTH